MAFLVLLVAAIGVLLIFKAAPQKEPNYTGNTSLPVSTSAKLIEQARANGQPAWLLFRSST